MALGEDYLEYRRNTNSFARFLGLEMTGMQEGYATGTLKIRDEFRNSHGTVHGGCLFTVADTIGGNVAASHGLAMTTLSSDFHYLKPCKDVSTIYIVGREIKNGRTVCLIDVEVSDGADVVFAKGTFTFFNLGKPLISDKAGDSN
ncbi:MAG: PaaI family thioesterase [Atopobiaceae bacterium]|nr:PaaI family thioesterase [Atopobiaceae bacterium]